MSTFLNLTRVSDSYGPVYLPPFAMETPALTGTQVLTKFLGAREAPVGEADWTTQRLLWNAQWNLKFNALQDEFMRAMTTLKLANFLLGCQTDGSVWTAQGADFMPMQDSPGTDISPAGSPRTVYRSTMPWWGTDVEVFVNGTLQTTGMTINAARGQVTFGTPLGSGAVVNFTGSRAPQVQVMNVQAMPRQGYNPPIYDVSCTLHEVSPV